MRSYLWALEGPVGGQTPERQAFLDAQLQQHVQVCSLHVIVQQVADHRRAYLFTEGCPGCLDERCEVGCRTDLVRRTMRRACPDLTLRHVPMGFAPRPYTQRVLAWPLPHARPIDGSFLDGMHDARVILHWQPGVLPRSPATLTVLWLGTEDQRGAERLREWGWWRITVPRRIPLFTTMHGTPPLLPPGRRPPFPPRLLGTDVSDPVSPALPDGASPALPDGAEVTTDPFVGLLSEAEETAAQERETLRREPSLATTGGT